VQRSQLQCYICGWYGCLHSTIVLVLCILVDLVDFSVLLADYVVVITRGKEVRIQGNNSGGGVPDDGLI
jgi:hypothetical protein